MLPARPSSLPLDLPGGVNTVSSARTVTAALAPEETRILLQEVPAAYHTRINDVLLTALVQAFAQWTGATDLLVDLEGHGRDAGPRNLGPREALFADLDVSRTVGWFTVLHPVYLDLADAWGPGEELKAVKEQLAAVPGGGLGYGLLRYLGDDREKLARLRRRPAAQVSFNYLGQLDSATAESSFWRPLAEGSGPAVGPGGLRTHLLEINGAVSGDRLRLNWSYSANLHRRATVESLAAGYLKALRSLIDHCLSPEAGGYTPADFPEARISQKDLDKLLTQVGTGSRR